ncbi:MAG TPA: hypothetical protein VFE05_08280 [Longimicrobiaceae bacterium]|nr:hypothetical protein [Longimicrobiaceae bacterium]
MNEEGVGLRLRARRVGVGLARTGRRVLGMDITVYVDQRVDEYRGYWQGAADQIGARLTPLARDVWEVTLGPRRTRISAHVTQADDPVTLRIAGDKPLCHRLASEAGVPVPEHLVFRLGDLAAARDRVASDPGPWVVKPARGSASGMGITTGVTTAAGLEAAAVLASLFGQDVMLERMVPGESYRLLYLRGEMVHAVRRRGARLTGDGVSTVRELAREAGLGSLLADPVAAPTLAAQGLGAGSIPEAETSVLLRGVPAGMGARELRTVYDETATHLVCSETAAALGRVVRELGSRFAGVDVITADPGVPLELAAGAFIEVNTTPGIHHHYQTDDDRRQHPVATRVLRHLLDSG